MQENLKLNSLMDRLKLVLANVMILRVWRVSYLGQRAT